MSAKGLFAPPHVILPSSVYFETKSLDGHPAYEQKIQRGANALGMRSSWATGIARIDNTHIENDPHHYVFIAADSSVFGGSLHGAAALQMLDAIDYASRHFCPVVLFVDSGGVRLQERAIGLQAMRPLQAALRAHRELGLPSAAFVRGDSFGAATVSLLESVQIVGATRGSRIGFSGSAPTQARTDSQVDPDSISAASAWKAGTIDWLIDDEKDIGHLVEVAVGTRFSPSISRFRELANDEISRDQFTAVDWATLAFCGQLVPLRGQGMLRTYLARYDHNDFVVIATDRNRSHPEWPDTPKAMMTLNDAMVAEHAVNFARERSIPIATFLDFDGGDPTPKAYRLGVSAAYNRLGSALQDHRAVAKQYTFVTGEIGSGVGGEFCDADYLATIDYPGMNAMEPKAATTIVKDGSADPLPAPMFIGKLVDRVINPESSSIAHVFGDAIRTIAMNSGEGTRRAEGSLRSVVRESQSIDARPLQTF